MRDCATAVSVNIAKLMIRVSMTMRMTMYVHAVMVQDAQNARSNINKPTRGETMKRVVYLNLTDCSIYETYVRGAVPHLKGFKVIEVAE
jgi:hypothetical protein